MEHYDRVGIADSIAKFGLLRGRGKGRSRGVACWSATFWTLFGLVRNIFDAPSTVSITLKHSTMQLVPGTANLTALGCRVLPPGKFNESRSHGHWSSLAKLSWWQLQPFPRNVANKQTYLQTNKHTYKQTNKLANKQTNIATKIIQYSLTVVKARQLSKYYTCTVRLKKTGPLRLIWHSFTNSQHYYFLVERDLIQFSIDTEKGF